MRVLIISHKPPYPPHDGGCLAIFNLSLGLWQSGINVEIFTIETQKHPFDKNLSSKIPFPINAQFIDTSIKPIKAFNSLIKNESYNISRFYNKNFEHELIIKLKKEKFDIIQLESLFVTPYINAIRKNTKAKIVYRSHNVEYKIWEHLANGEKQLLKRSYLKTLSKQLKEYEYSTLNKYDAAVFITEKDKKYYTKIGCKKPHITIPFSVDMNQYDPSHTNTHSICYLGSMDWLPNIEGVDWFIKKVWPQLKNNNMQFFLAGKRMPDNFKKLNDDNLKVVGAVDNAISFINEHPVMIVPLFSGSGMRVKIVEAMALGKIVIGTKLAFEGIEGVIDNENVLIAESASTFAEKITMIFNDTSLMKTIGENARKLIDHNYSITSNSKKLIDFYKNIVENVA